MPVGETNVFFSRSVKNYRHAERRSSAKSNATDTYFEMALKDTVLQQDPKSNIEEADNESSCVCCYSKSERFFWYSDWLSNFFKGSKLFLPFHRFPIWVWSVLSVFELLRYSHQDKWEKHWSRQNLHVLLFQKIKTFDEMLLNFGFQSGAKGCKSCRAWEMLKNDHMHLFAKIGDERRRTSRLKFSTS